MSSASETKLGSQLDSAELHPSTDSIKVEPEHCTKVESAERSKVSTPEDSEQDHAARLTSDHKPAIFKLSNSPTPNSIASQTGIIAAEPGFISGIKRNHESLFVTDDEDAEASHPQVTKRFKPNRADDTDVIEALTTLELDKNGKVPPYDPIFEGRPQYAIYHPDFRTTELLLSEICNSVLNAYKQLEDGGYSNEEIERLFARKLRKLATPQWNYPSIKPVACLGAAGVGKSSAINSILHERDAAFVSESDRGTNLVHEFSKSHTNQLSKYRVAARYLSPKQIELFVQFHCGNIFTYLEKKDDCDEDEDTELQAKYNTAIALFCVLLGHLTEFAEDGDAQDYFETRMDRKDKTIDQLVYLISGVKESRKLEDGIEYYDAEDTKELADVFKQVSRVAGRSKSSHPWPIIRKIDIYQDQALLNAGVVLADTPGIGDSNQAVVKATKDYNKRAGTILVFHNYKRIASNPTLDTNLKELILLGKMNGICLVVTGIDNLAKMNESEREELADDDKEALEQAELVLATLEARCSAVQKAVFGGDFKLMDEFRDLPKKVAAASSKVAQFVIQLKTQQIARELKDRLRRISRQKDAPGSSNLLRFDPSKLPLLDVQATGTPSLRHWLYKVPARGKSNTLRRICLTSLPAILNNVHSVLTKSPLARKEEARKTLIEVLSKGEGVVATLANDLKEIFDEDVVQAMNGETKRLQHKAEKLIDSWGRYHAGTFLAFCNRRGFWKPQVGAAKINWNESIQNLVDDKFDDGFDNFESNLGGVESNLVSGIEDMFRDLKTALHDSENYQGAENMPRFVQYVDGIHEGIKQDVTA